MSAEIVGNKLILDGYVYYHGKYADARRHWECRRLRTKECTARVVTNNPQPGEALIVFKKGFHVDHPPNYDECAAERVKASLKRRAEEHPEQPPTQLLRGQLNGLSQGKY